MESSQEPLFRQNASHDANQNAESPAESSLPPDLDQCFTREAQFYEKLTQQRVRCQLCPHGCLVSEGERGSCGVRENRAGVFYTLVHSRLASVQVDPIEKKPLFHFLPGSQAFSIATAGCNVSCSFCQNQDLAQTLPELLPAEYAPPESIATLARQSHCQSIAYTYSEPTISAEFVMDTVDAGHDLGLCSVAISNGYVQTKALRSLFGGMDAVKIDLKAFTEKFYREVVHGHLKPVLDALLTLRTMGKWIEIVYLTIPTLNDSELEIHEMAQWVKSSLGPDVPLHFTQFHPAHQLRGLPITPVATLERARAVAQAAGLHYVYIGNVPGHAAQNTYCPGCGKLLVERVGFTANKLLVRKDNTCPYCLHGVAGVWQA
ncbi:AmmeMemoRadiSam system radical SAM enzyme [Telmatobacter bradus]|uniref:AmmeMemoRadiSam system radical SAM enzyme n=1 Tax=Telmatobacter bradus TaxID=474953 RepID=UPI003B42D17F